MQAGFYEDERWCPRCRTYIWYIDGPAGAFCISCGHRVKLFRPQDWRAVLGRKLGAHARPSQASQQASEGRELG